MEFRGTKQNPVQHSGHESNSQLAIFSFVYNQKRNPQEREMGLVVKCELTFIRNGISLLKFNRTAVKPSVSGIQVAKFLRGASDRLQNTCLRMLDV